MRYLQFWNLPALLGSDCMLGVRLGILLQLQCRNLLSLRTRDVHSTRHQRSIELQLLRSGDVLSDHGGGWPVVLSFVRHGGVRGVECASMYGLRRGLL